MRPSHDPVSARSTTPIYDSLYAEYRRLFRALPGDRSGEEDLKFEGFGSGFGSGFGTVHGTDGAAWDGSVRQRGEAPWPVALPPAPRDGHGP